MGGRRVGAAAVIVRCIVSGCVFAVAAVTASAALAQCVRPIGAMPSLQGEAQVQAAGVWRPAALNEQLCPGDVIHVGARSRAEVTVVNQPNIRLDQNTGLHLPGDDQPLVVKLLYGAAYFFSRDPRRLTVDTPFVDAAVEGTEFLVQVEAERALIVVFEGRVRASNPQGELAIASGQAASAEAGRAPAPYLIVRPRDAVQWTLFYPSILPTLADPSGASAQQLAEPLRSAVALAARGDLPAAFAQFETIPDTDRDSDYYLYRAAALLSVGRVEEARADLGQAAMRDPGDGRADALSAVIAVAQNDRERALEDARRAVELSPRSAAAKIALSYALQARFQIEAARQAMSQAVEDEPENPLAWARLSELWLMQGRRDRARRAAQKARELAPELARAQTVLGFAELAETNTGRAKKAFRRAIDIDSANPLPRFGLGLATIRAGNLEGGRKEIEIAVALDPENALLRSYLGKAYFDERTTNPLTYFRELVENFPNQENTLAAQQFAISKELDPNDPTPWLYNAIRLQSENRPVEALRNIEKSIELNDNRAVYRSRELLDQDRAARGTSLARIYNDLGFEQLGINEATKSLSYDPANAGAHRFLSDVYATQPRHEIARASELLQAQLLQDININPVQPSLADPNIVARGGPARPGFDEFTPLFERNQAQLNLSGVVGSEWTRGEEAVVSGIYDNTSLSAGQFHYQSDGFRKNFDVQHDIYNIYAQAAVTPELNVQAEFRTRTSKAGDTQLDFDQNEFSKNGFRETEQDSGRVGLRYSPSPNSDILSSVVYTDRHFKQHNINLPLPSPFAGPLDLMQDARGDQSATQAEVQHIFRAPHMNIVSGAGYYDVETHSEGFLIAQTPSGIPIAATPDNAAYTSDEQTVYAFLNGAPTQTILGTFGISYDGFKERKTDLNTVNPKLGMQWLVTDRVRLRAAAFRSVKPSLIVSQTLQPTQIAGFDQYFDDINGTKSTCYGIGVDARLLDNVHIGADLFARDLDVPNSSTGHSIDQNEDLYRTYFYWTPFEEWAFSGELGLDRFHSDEPVTFIPKQLNTFSVPLAIRYFNPNGFFGFLSNTYAYQSITWDSSQTTYKKAHNNFSIVDFGIGYRFPSRAGLVSLGVYNILNQGFKYKDDMFRQEFLIPNQTFSPFIPERTIYATLVLSAW